MKNDLTDVPDVSNRQLLAWLHDAENDLGELADIVNGVAARQGMVAQAQRANAIAHKWIHRRSLRETGGTKPSDS